MKFRVGSNAGDVRYPILKNGSIVYSPLVVSGGCAVSPWESNVTLIPNREISIVGSFGDRGVSGGSSAMLYMPDNRVGSQSFVEKCWAKTISSYSKDDETGYYSWNRTSNSSYPTLSALSNHYYWGYEYDAEPPTFNVSSCAGLFWNMNAYSGFSGFNTNKLKYNVNGVVYTNETIFNTKTTGYSYSPVKSSDYLTEFDLDSSKTITKIDVSGDLQPFEYSLFISVKGSNYVMSTTAVDKECVMLGSYNNVLSGLSNSAMIYHTYTQRTLNSLYDETYRFSYFNGQVGLIKKFKPNQDSSLYFVIDATLPCSSMFSSTPMSGLSSPTLSMKILDSVDSPYGTDFYSYGAVWKNASATAYCVDGTTSMKTGDIYLSPTAGGGVINFLSACGLSPKLFVSDLKVGFSAM